MRSTICYNIVSNFYIDFIPQWGKNNDSNDIHFVFICDSHGCFYFPWGAEKKSSFEHSFLSTVFFFFPFWFVGCWNCNFNCLLKLRFSIMSNLNKFEIPVALVSTGLSTQISYHIFNFLIELIMLNTQDPYYCTPDAFSQQ